VVELDPEELYNSSHGLLIAGGHPIWPLQYRDFCGGCSIDAALAGLIYSLLPPLWLSWKLVPALWQGALVGLGTLWLRRVGPAAPLCWVLLMLAAPPAWQQLSQLAWGNHVEAGALAALAVLLAQVSRRPAEDVLAGGLAGMALAVSFSGAFAGPVTLLLLWRGGRSWSWGLFGLVLGLWPWAGLWLQTGHHPFVTIYERGEALPLLTRLPHKLQTLLGPRQLHGLFGDSRGAAWTGWAAALAAALALPAALRAGLGRWWWPLGAWAGIYLLVRFQVEDPPAPLVPSPGSVRYAAAAWPCLALALAVGAEHLWRHRRGGLWIAALLLPAGLLFRLEALAGLEPALLWRRPFEREHNRDIPSYALPLEAHQDCTSTDPVEQDLHAYALGRQLGLAHLGREPRSPPLPEGRRRPAALEGLGCALVDLRDGPSAGEWLSLEQVARDLVELGLTEAEQEQALRAALWRRVEGPADWARSLRDQQLPVVPDSPLGRALLFTAGRWRARSLAGPVDPEPVGPAEGLTGAPLHLEGMGQGLAEEWGPAADPLQISQDPAFLRGYARGLTLDWGEDLPQARR
jgi:hypothetical protein